MTDVDVDSKLIFLLSREAEDTPQKIANIGVVTSSIEVELMKISMEIEDIVRIAD